jgi:hypothetical protein
MNLHCTLIPRWQWIGFKIVACAALFGAPVALAGDPEYTVSIAVQQGDVFAPHGTVSNVNDIFVNDNGDWIVDASLTGGTASAALIVNGAVWLAVGDPLPPSSVSSLSNLLKHMNVHGDIAFRPSITGTPDSGIYLNQTPIVLEDDISTAPEFSPNTPYIGFFRARVNDNGDVFAVTSVDDPAIASSVDRALMWFNYDSKTMVLTEQVLAKEADAAPGTEPDVVFNDFGTDADRHAINNNRDALFVASLTGGGVPTDTNAGIFINNMLVVRKGDFSPIKDAAYNNISTSTRAHMNIDRDYLFIGTLSNQPSTTNVLVKGDGNTRNDTEILQKQGDPAPQAGGETITSFGTGVQPHITGNGNVVWYAQLSGDAATNQALYVNDQMIFRKGQTTVDGQLITTVAGTTSSSNGIGSSVVASPNGGFVITRCVLDAGPRAALLIEFEQPCPADFVSSDTFQPPGDGNVDAADLAFLLGEWGPNPGSPADMVSSKTFQPPPDGVVDAADLAFLLGAWGACE